MENSIALIPKVIEYWGKKMAEEQNEFIYVLPFNFNETKGIEISEIIKASIKEGKQSFDKDTEGHYVLGVKAPIGTKLYAPVSTERYQINFWKSFIFKRDKEWAFTFENLFKGVSFNDNQIDSRWLCINGAGGLEVFLTGEEKQGNFEGELKSEAQIGNLLAKVAKDQYIEFGADESKYSPADKYQFIIDHYIFQDEKAYDLGSKGLWSIEGVMFSILPSD